VKKSEYNALLQELGLLRKKQLRAWVRRGRKGPTYNEDFWGGYREGLRRLHKGLSDITNVKYVGDTWLGSRAGYQGLDIQQALAILNPKEKTRDYYLRGLPDTLRDQLKAKAHERGISLPKLIIRILKGSVASKGSGKKSN
jgi:hypothetical protein